MVKNPKNLEEAGVAVDLPALTIGGESLLKLLEPEQSSVEEFEKKAGEIFEWFREKTGQDPISRKRREKPRFIVIDHSWYPVIGVQSSWVLKNDKPEHSLELMAGWGTLGLNPETPVTLLAFEDLMQALRDHGFDPEFNKELQTIVTVRDGVRIMLALEGGRVCELHIRAHTE